MSSWSGDSGLSRCFLVFFLTIKSRLEWHKSLSDAKGGHKIEGGGVPWCRKKAGIWRICIVLLMGMGEAELAAQGLGGVPTERLTLFSVTVLSVNVLLMTVLLVTVLSLNRSGKRCSACARGSHSSHG